VNAYQPVALLLLGWDKGTVVSEAVVGFGSGSGTVFLAVDVGIVGRAAAAAAAASYTGERDLICTLFVI
jgi:hypothetical protein